MAVSDDIKKKFAEDFNKRMAGTGRVHTPVLNETHNKAISREDQAYARENSARIAQDVKEAKKTSTRSTSTAKTKEFAADTIDKKAQTKELKNEHDKKGFWEKAFSTAARPLDIISRPSYAVSEALRQIPKNFSDGEPLWSLADDIIYGAGQGLSGNQKTNAGDVLNEVKANMRSENPSMVLRLLASKTPGFSVEEQAGDLAKENVNIERGENGKLLPELVDKMWEEDSGPARTIRRLSGGSIQGDKGVQKFVPGVGDFLTDPTMFAGAKVAGNAVRAATSSKKGAILLGDAATDYVAKNATEVARHVIDGYNPSLMAKKAGGAHKFQVTQGDVFKSDVYKLVIDSFQEIKGGGMAGRAISGPEMPKVISNKIAEGYKAKLISGMEKDFKWAEGVADGSIPPPKNTAAWTSFGKKSKYHQTYLELVDGERKLWLSTLSSSKAKAPTAHMTSEWHKRAAQGVQEVIDSEASLLYKEVAERLSSLPTRAITFQVLNGNKIVLRRTSDFIDHVGKYVGDTTVGRTLGDAFSYKKAHPGYTSLIGQKAKSMGVKGYHDYYIKIRELSKDLTREDRRILNDALHKGLPLSGPLEDMRLVLRKEYDDLFEDEIIYGIRPPDTIQVKDYSYLYLHGGSEEARNEFLKKRSEEIKQFKRPVTTTFDDAIKAKLKPEKDAVKALLLRKAASQRKFTRTWYLDDLTKHYGIISKKIVNPLDQRLRELKLVDKNSLPKSTRETLKDGEEFYLPDEIYKSYTAYNDMAKLNNEKASRDFLKAVDYVNRKFKTMSTVYYPSYHIRNMIGDMYMGMLDGVQLKDYFQFFERGKYLPVGDRLMPRAAIKAEFDKTASAGGFLNTEVGQLEGMLRGPAQKVQQGVRNFSEGRENYGRFVHFYHALNEEYKLLGNTMTNADKWKKAVDAATARVNAYKFDYSAKTKFEKNVMNRVIPFYTYSRKAMPLLADSLLFNPKHLSMTNRMMERMSDQGNLDSMAIPDWVREVGYIPFADNESLEPTVLRQDFLPTNVFNQNFNPGYEPGGGVAEPISRNILQQINPIAQVGIEASQGKLLFSGQKANLAEILASKVRPVGTYKQVQGALEAKGAQKWVALLTGLPVTKITEGMQKSAFKSHEDAMQATIRTLNADLLEKGYKLGYVKREDGQPLEYRVYKLTTDKQSVPWLTGYSTLNAAAKALHDKVKG